MTLSLTDPGPAPFTYVAIRRDASRISRSLPSWSISIDTDRRGQNMLSGEAVGRFLEGATQHEIY